MRGVLAAVVAAAFLVACGGGGGGSPDPEPVPAGVPALTGGFVNFFDYAETPGHVFGIVNATGQALTHIELVGPGGVVYEFADYVGPGQTWLDVDGDVPPEFYALFVDGAGGALFSRYHRYDGAGRDAAYVSNANRDFGF